MKRTMGVSKRVLAAPFVLLLLGVAPAPAATDVSPGGGLHRARVACGPDGRCFDDDDDADGRPPHRRFDPDDDRAGPRHRFDPDDEDDRLHRRRFDPDDDDRPPPPHRRFDRGDED